MLNKANGNMYHGWVTHTWNPLNGECKHDCEYCYVKSMRYVKEIYSGPYRLNKAINDRLGSGHAIFVCSCNDLFEKDVPSDFIRQVLDNAKKYSNTYIWQSKNPARTYDFIGELPPSSIIGTTIETNRAGMYHTTAPTPADRARAMCQIRQQHEGQMFITIEPILDFDIDAFVELIKSCSPDFVNIGADSKQSSLPEPTREKIIMLIEALKTFTEIKIKANLHRFGITQPGGTQKAIQSKLF